MDDLEKAKRYLEFGAIKTIEFKPIQRLYRPNNRPFYRRYLHIVFQNDKQLYIPFHDKEEKNLLVKVEN